MAGGDAQRRELAVRGRDRHADQRRPGDRPHDPRPVSARRRRAGTRADATSNGLTTRASQRRATRARRLRAWRSPAPGHRRAAGDDGRPASIGGPPAAVLGHDAAAAAARPRGRGPGPPATRASAAACSAPTGRPAFGASSKVDGIPGVPNAAASASHRSRHAAGVSTGASRCAPGQPRQRPRAGHHPVGVVPAAARREPSAARPPVRDPVDQPRRLPHRRRRHPQVRERVPGVRVGAVLRDDDVRPERRGERRDQRTDGGQPRRLPRVRLERHVDRGADGRALPQVVDEPGPREQVPPALVERDRQHARVGVRDRLDAVAVVRVEVDVQHAQAGGSRPDDRQRRVVVDAEAPRLGRHRVVEPAARVQGVLDVPAQDRLHRAQRAVGDGGASLVHARERRVVGDADPHRRPRRRVGGEPPNGLDVRGRMDRLEVVVRGRLGLERRLRARPLAGGRSPARTGAASAGGRGRSRRSASADRRRGAGRQRARDDDAARVLDTFGTIPPWSACTRPPGSTSSA